MDAEIKWSVILWTAAIHPSTVEVGGKHISGPVFASGVGATHDVCRMVAFLSGELFKGADGMYYGSDGRQVVIHYE